MASGLGRTSLRRVSASKPVTGSLTTRGDLSDGADPANPTLHRWIHRRISIQP